jgi:superfamily I DNA/RNA helicase
MRSMASARARARDTRRLLGEMATPAERWDGMVGHIKERWKIDVVGVPHEQMEGSRAEVDVANGIIKYDETLSIAERLEEVAHEFGHLVLHNRLTDPSAQPDPVLASVYGDAGAAAIARYSPKVREEAEANAFAFEFLCPSSEAFALWRGDEASTIATIAGGMGVTTDVARVQLANALHDLAIGSEGSEVKQPFTLTDEQRAAATFVGKPALVDAGPGTGKTATLIGRVEFLLGEKGAAPEQILVMTFSNEAAQELAERIAAKFGAEIADRLTISTFHGFGMEMLHYHGALLGYEDDPRLLDEDAQAELVYELLGRLPCASLIALWDPWETATKIVDHINHCKHFLIPSDALDNEELVGIYREYERVKQERQQVDFADLIQLPLEVLETHADVREAYRAKYAWVLVDEFQDVSRATSGLLQAICGTENPPWVVGDARQAIYRFLGASPDNIREFAKDFEEAQEFRLDVNYRSSDPVIGAANELAALMDPKAPTAWTRGSDTDSLGAAPVAMAEADSEYAEHSGIVAQIREWIAAGVSPGDIAVLARRHVDVRETMLALTEAGIQAQAAGLLTAEGAAGDLAAVLTVADAAPASIPRLAYALGRERLDQSTINTAIAGLLEREREARQAEREGREAVARQPVCSVAETEIGAIRELAERERFSGDGFAALTTFLFDSSSYLRGVLDARETAERAMTLIEIVSTLSLATAYRATHVGVQPREARLGFAERLRVHLTETIPIPLVPKPRGDAVRVMTCHASKGLEFPCVIVSGQTVPKIRDNYPWLPERFRPTVNEDLEQADALMFVGVTRAKRALVVSYPTSKSGPKVRGRTKTVVPLAVKWRGTGGVPVRRWVAEAPAVEIVAAGAIWGTVVPPYLKASSLRGDSCAILTYLENFLGIRFPEEERALYPVFFDVVRRVLRRLVGLANETHSKPSAEEALRIVDEEWPADRYADHAHLGLFRPMAVEMALGFARAFEPAPGRVVSLEPWVQPRDGGPKVSLELVARFEQADGRVVAILFRPESMAKDADEGTLSWGKLGAPKRIPFVLLRALESNTMVRVYSGADRAIYDFEWSNRPKLMSNQEESIMERYDALARNDFSAEPGQYKCDRCPARVSCPHWIGALPGALAGALREDDATTS